MFIFSKLHNLDNLKNIKKEDLISRINFSIFESLNKLKSSSLEIFFVHNPKIYSCQKSYIVIYVDF